MCLHGGTEGELECVYVLRTAFNHEAYSQLQVEIAETHEEEKAFALLHCLEIVARTLLFVTVGCACLCVSVLCVCRPPKPVNPHQAPLPPRPFPPKIENIKTLKREF